MDINFVRKHQFTLFHSESDLVKADDNVPLVPPPDFRSQLLDESHQETSGRIDSTASNSPKETSGDNPDDKYRDDEDDDDHDRYSHDYDNHDQDDRDRDDIHDHKYRQDEERDQEDRDQDDRDQTGRHSDNDNIATDYELDLAARAYANLFSERRFSLDELKPAALDRALAAYKLETADKRQRDLGVYTDQTEYDKHDDYYYETYIKDAEISRDCAPEDYAWSKLFANRPFDLDELRPGVRWQAMTEWRDEVLRLNKEDHELTRQNQDASKPYDCEPEQSSKVSEQPANYSASWSAEASAINFSKAVDIEIELKLLSESDPKRANDLRSFLQQYEGTKESSDKAFPKFADHSLRPTDNIDKLLFGENASLHLDPHNKTQAEIQIEGWQKDAFNPLLINLQNERSNSIHQNLAEDLQRNLNSPAPGHSLLNKDHEREDNEGDRNR